MGSRSRSLRRLWAALLTLFVLSGCAARRSMCTGAGAADAAKVENHSLVWADSASTPAQPRPRADGSATEPTNEFGSAHPRVDAFVNGFKTRRRESFQDALDPSGQYRLRMVAILKREGVPTELAYLPLIESGYRPSAVSPAGAVGPWQFTRQTGQGYGLRIDAYVDERRDPIRSTRAAACYLRDLHDAFGSWHSLAPPQRMGSASEILRRYPTSSCTCPAGSV